MFILLIWIDLVRSQGGRQCGYALHLRDGRPVFSVRIDEKLHAIQAPAAPEGRFSLAAALARDGRMTLAVNGRVVAEGQAPGLIPRQPQDELSIGEDTRTAVGDYTPPHPLKGRVENVGITTE